MAHKRLTADERKAQIIETGLEMAATGHYRRVTRDHIADALGMSAQNIHYHFGTMGALRDAIVGAAVAEEVLPVIAQALVERDPAASGISEDLQRAALSAATQPTAG